MGIITMVVSGKDGVGKSTASVFIADAIAALGKKVLVLELDSGFRNIDIIAGTSGEVAYDILDVLSGRCTADTAIVKVPAPRSNLYILAAPLRQDALQGAQFLSLCNTLVNQFDHVIIDTASLNGTTIAASAVSTNAVLVATADPLSVRDSRIINDRLKELSVPSVRLLINRLVPSRIEAGVLPSLDYVIDHIGAQLIGVIPESSEIAIAAATGQPLVKKTIEAEIFGRIALRMYGDDVPLVIQ